MRYTSDTAFQRPELGVCVYETLSSAPLMGFIGNQVMPPFYVPVFSMEYPVIPKEALFNLINTARGPLGHYNRAMDEFESGHFKCTENGLERRIDDRYAAIYSSMFAYELTIANILMNEILRGQEMAIAAKIMNVSNFTPVNAAVNWATSASCTPKIDIETGKNALRQKGIIANTLILNYTSFLRLRLSTALQNAIFYLFPDAARTGDITVAHLQAYFDIPKILVAGALYNTAQRGVEASLSDMWGTRYAMLCRTAAGDTADIIEPCIGRTFLWNEGVNQQVIVEEYYSNEVRSRILRVRYDSDDAFLASYDNTNTVKSEISKACGYLIDTTAAT